MKLLIIGHKYQYEMLKLTQIFYPNTKIDLLFSSADTGDDETVITTELTKDNITVSFAEQKSKRFSPNRVPKKRTKSGVWHLCFFCCSAKTRDISPSGVCSRA